MMDAYEFCRGIKVLLLSEMPPDRRPIMQGIHCAALNSCTIEIFGAPVTQLRAFATLIKTHLLEFHKIQQIKTTFSYRSGGIVLRWDSVPDSSPAPAAIVIQISSFHHFRTKPRAPIYSPKPISPIHPKATS